MNLESPLISYRDFSRNFSRGGGRLIEKHALDLTKACFSLSQDLLWKVVNIFTLVWMWAAAVYICMCSIQILKVGKTAMKGGKIPPLALCRKKPEVVDSIFGFLSSHVL